MRGLLDITAQPLLDTKDRCIKGLALSLFLGMMVVFVLLIGYWLRTPYAISAQWDHSADHARAWRGELP